VAIITQDNGQQQRCETTISISSPPPTGLPREFDPRLGEEVTISGTLSVPSGLRISVTSQATGAGFVLAEAPFYGGIFNGRARPADYRTGRTRPSARGRPLCPSLLTWDIGKGPQVIRILPCLDPSPADSSVGR
jgi:hypothetical protein